MRKPNWVNLSVVYYLFHKKFGKAFTQLTMSAQLMLVGDYVAWVLADVEPRNGSDFEVYVASWKNDGNIVHQAQTIVMMHVAWGVEE